MALPPALTRLLAQAAPGTPVLLAGPTGSGKSAVALDIAQAFGGVVVNADALQVYDCWQVLTARPDAADCAAVPHLLYGMVGRDDPWSVGHWLRAVAPIVAAAQAGDGPRPILTGGTGLYFSALTEGLAEIPPIPDHVRAEAQARLATEGLAALLADLDPATRAGIDPANPARVARAWEVARATGTGLADWKARTGAPLLPVGAAVAVALLPDRDWLNPRIDARFAAMLAGGALEEVRALLPKWDAHRPWAQAIGAAELVSHLRGETTLDAAAAAACTASRRYAKRQRAWVRSRIGRRWTVLDWPGDSTS